MRVRAAVCFLLMSCLVAVPCAAQVTIGSFNTLRYGHVGKKGKNQVDPKDAVIRNMAEKGAAVIALQEVMVGGLNSVPPGGWEFTISSAFGPSGYKEYYAILVNINVVMPIDEREYPKLQKTFSRPPLAVMFDSGGVQFWVADFHAIWGRTVGGRRDEAHAAGILTQELQTQSGASVVVAGDWNITAEEIQKFGGFATVNPDLLTTVSRTGVPTSSYDHFAMLSSSKLTFTQPVIFFPAGIFATPPNVTTAQLTLYRTTVSDHLPVTVTLN